MSARPSVHQSVRQLSVRLSSLHESVRPSVGSSVRQSVRPVCQSVNQSISLWCILCCHENRESQAQADFVMDSVVSSKHKILVDPSLGKLILPLALSLCLESLTTTLVISDEAFDQLTTTKKTPEGWQWSCEWCDERQPLISGVY